MGVSLSTGRRCEIQRRRREDRPSRCTPVCFDFIRVLGGYQSHPLKPPPTPARCRTQMLDLIRFFVVWNPVILTGLHFVFHWTGLEDSLDQPGFDPAQPWNGTAVGLNATANVTLG